MGCLCAKPLPGLMDAYITAPTSEPIPSEAGGCGVDICGLENTKFIIQSGTHYTEVYSLQNQLSVGRDEPLREVCRYGDHYLGRFSIDYSGSQRGDGPTTVNNFYIIKGKSCRMVKSLCDSYGPDSIFDLHPDCRGGDHYFANREGFYIIRSEDNTYLKVQSMSEQRYRPAAASRHKLHESFTDGLYYFATDGYFYVVKEHPEFGVVYHRTKDLGANIDAGMFPVHHSIASGILLYKSTSLNQRVNIKYKAGNSGSTGTAVTTQLSPPQDPAPPQDPVPIQTSLSTEITESLQASSYVKPNSINLSVIKWKDASGKVETFRLKASIIHKWRDVGNLIVPRQLLETWAREKDAKASCDAVLSYWLDNPSPYYPATWKGLYELLNDSELGQVASDLKQAVDNVAAVAVHCRTETLL